jgi:hypothetical protein
LQTSALSGGQLVAVHMHVPLTHLGVLPGQLPQLPPQPSPPHAFLAQDGVQRALELELDEEFFRVRFRFFVPFLLPFLFASVSSPDCTVSSTKAAPLRRANTPRRDVVETNERRRSSNR